MHENHNMYVRLLVMSVLSFISMYILMYSMVNTWDNVFSNFNQFYMAATMTAPMVVFELLLMGSMYQNKRLNAAIIAGSVFGLIVFFMFIRQQTAVRDEQFIRSMIPHHSGAILMCEEATLQDAELATLCDSIIQAQQEEIDLMKDILERLQNQ
ncbi:MAG TPA: DUF305 domain-containing protein [Anaerolineales bacterium]|nr:DUF305 domain-containing protein [Anaerolineales bacterium]